MFDQDLGKEALGCSRHLDSFGGGSQNRWDLQNQQGPLRRKHQKCLEPICIEALRHYTIQHIAILSVSSSTVILHLLDH